MNWVMKNIFVAVTFAVTFASMAKAGVVPTVGSSVPCNRLGAILNEGQTVVEDVISNVDVGARPFVGISLNHFGHVSGDLPLMLSKVAEYTDGVIPIVVGGYLDRHNRVAFGDRSLNERVLADVSSKEAEIISHISAVVESDFRLNDRFIILGWRQITATEEYSRSLSVLSEHHQSNPYFQQIIEAAAHVVFSTRAPGKTPKPKRVRAVGAYILEELPLIMGLMKIEGISYSNFFHPVAPHLPSNSSGAVNQIVDSIFFDPNLRELRNELDLGSNRPGSVDLRAPN